MSSRTIEVDYLARVEGEGALRLEISEQGDVRCAELRIFEPPRFFEGFLRGRAFGEAPDITARICGICPVAYQMSAVAAMEDALGVDPGPEIAALRRLLYCGEWIESHVLHVAMLHLPDFLGYAGAVDMARDHPDLVRTALRLKKAGNALVRVIGGREIHPVNVRVGGFHRAPTRAELEALVPELEWAAGAARDLVATAAGLTFPDFQRDYHLVALRHPTDYPMGAGRVVSSAGLDFAPSELHEHIVEEHLPRSNALHATLVGHGAYLVGPLARFFLNRDRLSETTRQAAAEAGLAGDVRPNPFQSIVVRALEVLEAVGEALRGIAAYRPPERPFVAAAPRAATGYGCTEAPRGLLYHRYRLAADGSIEAACIIPPTSQNQRMMELDLEALVPGLLELDDDALCWRCEQAIRNYDPCISCATHFLRLSVDRAPSG